MFDKSVSLFTVSGTLITDDEIDLGQVYVLWGFLIHFKTKYFCSKNMHS